MRKIPGKDGAARSVRRPLFASIRREDRCMEVFFGKYFFSLFLILLFGIRLGTQHSARDKELRHFG